VKKMSWDITLTEKKCVDVEVSDVGNYTYNVSKMYGEAMGETLSYFHDMKAIDAIDLLYKGVIEMENNPDKYKSMNPENGWGNYEGALEYLKELLNACVKNPNATIQVY
jgi:hypothetical protein